jgi:hypothetical protein
MDMMIAYDCPAMADAMNDAVATDITPEQFRQMYARGYSTVRMLADWALNNGGSVVYTELCSGVVMAPADKIDQDIHGLVQRMQAVSGMIVHVGIGFDLKQSQTAVDWCVHTVTVEPKYYDPQMAQDLSPQDPELDLNALVGSHEPMLGEEQEIFDQPKLLNKSLSKAEDDTPKSDQEMDAMGPPPAKQEEQQPGAEDPNAIDPLGLLGEVTDEIKKQASKIESFKQTDPDFYELHVDILRGISAAVKALTPPELQGDGEGAKLGEGKSEDEGHGEIPVGTVHKGRVKVRLPEGGTTWVSAKSGQVAGGVSGAATKDYFGTDGGGGGDGGEGA